MADDIQTTRAQTVTTHSDEGTIARLASQRAQYKASWKEVLLKNEEQARILEQVLTENESLKVRADTSQAAKRVEELELELRGIKHRKVFDQIATELKAKPEALEDLWKLSGYTSDTETADTGKIRELLSEQAKQRTYLFTETPATPPAPVKQEPGPGNNRGTLVTNSGKFEVRRGLVGGPKDKEWMQVNQARYHKESQAGNVEWVD